MPASGLMKTNEMRSFLSNSSANSYFTRNTRPGHGRVVGGFLQFLAQREGRLELPLAIPFTVDRSVRILRHPARKSQAVVRRNCRSWASLQNSPWLKSCCELVHSSFRGAEFTLREGQFPLESSEEGTPNVSHIFNLRPSASSSPVRF